MKNLIVPIAVSAMAIFNTSCSKTEVKSFAVEGNTVTVETRSGNFVLKPLGDNALRVKFQTCDVQSLPEWVYEENDVKTRIDMTSNSEKVEVRLPLIRAEIDKQTARISFYDTCDNLILNELSRSVVADSVQDRATFNVTETFSSPNDEHLFGLGQFQDGYLDVRGLPRRLTQVNTQISIPFVLSSKGYGLLWNNYGLTNFNIPADTIALVKKSAEGDAVEVNVTTTEGNRRERRESNRFEATLEIAENGQYALLLDVGQQMARRHNLQIDGQTIMEMRNLWLPPTSSAIVELEKALTP